MGLGKEVGRPPVPAWADPDLAGVIRRIVPHERERGEGRDDRGRTVSEDSDAVNKENASWT